ncbi:hypothetical protein DMNBHIDG_02525 [Candidatus Methanoperedenaceae archaeon GB37]|nr:hypothetical protein DMNBHIDG_02525 [Candidatus Methanoperedenaceae archaeon GB37]
MISAMAQCRMQIEKCKIAFCQIGTLARLHVRTFTRLNVNTLEMGIGNWELGISIFYFLFSIFLTVFCRFDLNSTTFGYFIPSLFHYSLI